MHTIEIGDFTLQIFFLFLRKKVHLGWNTADRVSYSTDVLTLLTLCISDTDNFPCAIFIWQFAKLGKTHTICVFLLLFLKISMVRVKRDTHLEIFCQILWDKFLLVEFHEFSRAFWSPPHANISCVWLEKYMWVLLLMTLCNFQSVRRISDLFKRRGKLFPRHEGTIQYRHSHIFKFIQQTHDNLMHWTMLLLPSLLCVFERPWKNIVHRPVTLLNTDFCPFIFMQNF